MIRLLITMLLGATVALLGVGVWYTASNMSERTARCATQGGQMVRIVDGGNYVCAKIEVLP